MIEVFQFVFASFWHWLGTLILLVATFGALGQAIGHARGRKETSK